MFRRVSRVGLGICGGIGGVLLVSDKDFRDTAKELYQDGSFSGLMRFGRTIGNVAITAVDYKMTLYNHDKKRNRGPYKTALQEVNLRTAERLYKVCHANGGLYTKFGQGIANMNNVLPKEFTKILAQLQDKARELSFDSAREAVQKELGDQLFDDVFSSFDSKPVGAASLAQVHRATLKSTGEEVAVKVQYPWLESQTRGDLATLRLITRVIGFLFPEFSYTWLTPEFENNMTLELDFIQEGRNAERLSRMLQYRSDVYVPKIKWGLSTKRMLLMEFVHGCKVTDVEWMSDKGIHPLDVAATVSSVFGDMIHVHGFIHVDPHGSNLFIREPPETTWWTSSWKVFSFMALSAVPMAVLTSTLAVPGSTIGLIGASGALGLTAVGQFASFLGGIGKSARETSASRGNPYQLVVLDHGMYRRFSLEFRKSYSELWRSLLLRDTLGVRAAALKLGINEPEADVLSLILMYRPPDSTGVTGSRMSKEERQELTERFKDTTAADVNDFLNRLPRDLLFCLRCTNIVRSINLTLGGTSRERFKIMGECAVRGILLQDPSEEEYEHAVLDQESEVPLFGPYVVNLPVASELNTESHSVSWLESVEIWRLKTYLYLIDRSWAVLAALVR